MQSLQQATRSQYTCGAKPSWIMPGGQVWVCDRRGSTWRAAVGRARYGWPERYPLGDFLWAGVKSPLEWENEIFCDGWVLCHGEFGTRCQQLQCGLECADI
jgi:hypothetical protein